MAKTPPTLLEQAVTQDDSGWGFQCPRVAGSPCGDPGGPGFASTGWPDKKTAAARGQQHFDEHKLSAEIQAEIKTAVRVAVAEALAGIDQEALAEATPEDAAAITARVTSEAAAEVDREAIAARVTAASEYSVTPELEVFRAEHGLTVDPDGNCVKVEDL